MAETVPVESVSDLAYRYLKEILATQRQSEFAMDDLDRVREFIDTRFTDDELHILHVYKGIEREFTSGHRCSVCGRTVAQSKAIGYDCAREC